MRAGRWFAIAGVALVLGMPVGCADSEIPDTAEQGRPASVEQGLASLDAGSPLPEDDRRIGAYRTALESLEPYCGSNRTRLADQAVVTQERLAERDVEESLLSILQHVRQSIPDDADPSVLGEGCVSVFAGYVLLRTEG